MTVGEGEGRDPKLRLSSTVLVVYQVMYRKFLFLRIVWVLLLVI